LNISGDAPFNSISFFIFYRQLHLPPFCSNNFTAFEKHRLEVPPSEGPAYRRQV
jgi:hypothetical protein